MKNSPDELISYLLKPTRFPEDTIHEIAKFAFGKIRERVPSGNGIRTDEVFNLMTKVIIALFLNFFDDGEEFGNALEAFGQWLSIIGRERSAGAQSRTAASPATGNAIQTGRSKA